MDKVKKNKLVSDKNKPLVCDMSGVYGLMYPEGRIGDIECKWVDMTDISGTNCYCDDEAAGAIRERLFPTERPGIHFIDSGNYHYLSYFFMERMAEDFCLVLVDNHTDMQPPGFGRILSCGGWVRYAMEELFHLKRVYLIGVGQEHKVEAGDPDDRVVYVEHKDLSELKDSIDLPIYISIDKDALSHEYAATDWDQGQMELGELTEVLKVIEGNRILGVDICGEKKDSPTKEELFINISTDRKLLEFFYK